MEGEAVQSAGGGGSLGGFALAGGVRGNLVDATVISTVIPAMEAALAQYLTSRGVGRNFNALI